MIAKVIPAIKLPRQSASFDYSVGEGLEVSRGSLVFVPWRNRMMLGVVQEVAATSAVPESKLKPLAGLALHGRLPENWLAAMEWGAERYLTPLGTMVKCFLPTPPKRLKPAVTAIGSGSEGDETKAKRKSDGKRPLVSPIQEAPAAEQLHFNGNRGRVRLYGSPEEKWRVLAEAVSRCLKSGHSVIVLAPHQDDIRDTNEKLAAVVNPARTVELHGQMAAGRLWRNWSRDDPCARWRT